MKVEIVIELEADEDGEPLEADRIQKLVAHYLEWGTFQDGLEETLAAGNQGAEIGRFLVRTKGLR